MTFAFRSKLILKVDTSENENSSNATRFYCGTSTNKAEKWKRNQKRKNTRGFKQLRMDDENSIYNFIFHTLFLSVFLLSFCNLIVLREMKVFTPRVGSTSLSICNLLSKVLWDLQAERACSEMNRIAADKRFCNVNVSL